MIALFVETWYNIGSERIDPFFDVEVIALPANRSSARRGGFLYAANNVRKNLLRIYRRQKWRVSHLWLFPVVFLYSEFFLRVFCGLPVLRTFLYPVLFGLAAGLFCVCLTSWFKPKVNRIISAVLLAVIAVYFSTECLLQNSFQVFMTPADIATGTGGVVGGFAAELFRTIFHGLGKIFIFLLPLILYLGTGKRRMPAKRLRPAFIGCVFVLALVLQLFTGLVAARGKQGPKYSGQFNFNTATQTFGLTTSTRLAWKYAGSGNKTSDFVIDSTADTQGAASDPTDTTGPTETETEPVVYGENKLDLTFKETSSDNIQALNQYVQSLTPSKQNAYTGLFKGKNLIYICAEAYCDSVVYEELTPTLYRLIHNGIYFSEFYQPTWGGSTSTGEYSFLFGLAPMDGVETMQETADNNNYFTLGNQLKRIGYHGNAYHDGDYDFYNRNITHTSLGYDEFLAYGNGLEEITDWWTGDITLFDKTMDTYMDNQPFSVYYMTISGHCTYVDDDYKVAKYLDRVKAYFGEGKFKQTTLDYFCYQMELEEALKLMVQKLEEKGIADDTVIVMTGDHYPYGLEKSHTFGNFEDYVSDLYGYTYTNSWEQDHNNLILWSGCLEHENKDMAVEISEPCYSLDVVPTLSNLFGLEYDSRLLVGRDVFSDTEAIALWNNYSWATVQGKYDAITGTYYPNEGYTEDQAYIDRINQIVSNKLSFSEKVLHTDYYGYLFD